MRFIRVKEFPRPEGFTDDEEILDEINDRIYDGKVVKSEFETDILMRELGKMVKEGKDIYYYIDYNYKDSVVFTNLTMEEYGERLSSIIEEMED